MALALIGLIGGLITGVSPCILPVLPVVFFGGASPGAEPGSRVGRGRPFLVVLGLVLSFAAFTLFGTFLISLLNLPADLIRWLGLAVLVVLGLALIIPPLERLLERPFSRIPLREVRTDRGGFVLGLALGAVFVPCAGPVLAAITVAGATGNLGPSTFLLTIGFSVGTAIPLLVFAIAGRQMSTRIQAFRRHQRAIRAVSGSVMIALAVALTFNLTDALQRYVPDYTQAVGNALEHGLAGQQGAASSSLQQCQLDAYYGMSTFGDCGKAPEFAGIQQWLNTPGDAPLTLAGLKGKVVLIDFWAYSCINCQRELPHVEAWAKDYAAAGLVVVGVHTPEYSFEHVVSNVEAGAQRLGVTFPVAIDNAYGTWNAYSNDSWPAGYLIDATGEIRDVTAGEGGYPYEESLIRQLLQEAHPGVVLPAATDLPDTTPTDRSQTPETYLGAERAQYYGGSGSYATGTRAYALPGRLAASTFGLGGTWTIGDESIAAGTGAELEESFHASKVYLDVGGTGTLTVTDASGTRTLPVSGAPNIYTVVSTADAEDGTVTIALSPGLTAYSFTFG